MNKILRGLKFYYAAARWPEVLAPLLDMAFRGYLASVFFKSGLTKIKNWDSTLYLFNDEYQVPLLPPDVAAYMATAGELVLPILLLAGLFGRFSAAGLFILNLVAAISYYAGLSVAGLQQHAFWGALLLVLLVLSRGRWSLDAWLEKRI